jgi:hypothetical protein
VDRSPVVHPLDYPGERPSTEVLLRGDRFVDLDLAALDVAGRHAVLAVGSNAGRARLVEKLGHLPGEQVVPVIPVDVEGLAVAFTPMVASYGSIPYTAVAGAGLRCRTYLQFLDDAQLEAIDASEQPAYRRDLLTEVRVELPGGRVRGEVWAYVCLRGAICDAGELVSLRPQAEVLALLARWLPDLVPADPVAAVDRLRAEPERRRAVADGLSTTGRVRLPTPSI